MGLLDDDARGVTIGPTSISLHEPASGETAVAGSYTVNLNTRPTDTVTVTIGGNVSSVSLSGDTLTNNQLTFTTTNWNTAQTITVTPVKDDNAVGETVTLTHTLSGGDYVGIAADSVTVNLIDSDTGNLVLSKQSLTVTEGDATGVRYTVKLATKPSGEVTVTISGHASRDLTLDKTTLTFTVGNWNTAQTVTVEAGHDDDDANDNATLTHTASGGDYASVTKNLLVTVTDDDEAAVVLSETGLTVTEGDAAGSSYTVVLATEPTGEVTVTVSGHVSTDLTLNKTTLTFRVNNWNTAQTVTVKAGQDDDAATMKHTASVSNTLPVTLTDDDTAAIVLSRTALTVTEGDAAGSTYTVVLATEPTGEVTVTVSGHAGTDLTLDKTTLTFTVDSWDTAQTVTVKAIEDVDAANDTATLTHTASGGDYASVTKNLLVTVTDDDTPDIVLSETGLTVTEGDAAGSSYTVKLATQPTGSVSVSITGHAGTDLTLDNTTLTFTVDNWDTAQTVTVKAGQDDDAASDTGTLTHTASGGDYASVTKNLPVTVTDDDTPAVVLSETGLTVTEGDAAGTSYTVSLATEPSGSVSVSITGHAGTDLTLDKTTLTFTVDNWDTAQTVTVKAGQDDDAANDTATLTHTASGGDYASITADLPVTLTDDDTAAVVLSETGLTVTEGDAAGTSYTVSLVTDDDEQAVVLSETGLTVTEGDAAGSSYTVKLATRPSGSVTVSISGHNGTDLSLSGTTLSSNMLTFTVDNWNTVQTGTVKAGQDYDTATLTHTASGGDYASVSNTLPVTVTDNDEAGVTLEPTALSVVAGRSNQYTLALATEPTGEVIVTVSGHAGTDVTLDKTTPTFAVDNWDTAQTVAVSATQNAATAKVTLAHAVAGADYASVTAEPVVVSVVAVAGQQPTLQVGVSSSMQTLTIPEGGANSYTLVLGSRPTGDVTVDVTLPTGTDLMLDKTSLTFTSTNWDVAQTVAVTAAEDDDAVTDAGVTLTHTVSGGRYNSTTVPDVEVSITENDTAGLVLSETGLTVTEGDAAESSYTVKLATEPTGEVTVTISGHAGTDLSLDNTPLTFTVDNWNTVQTVTVEAGQDHDGANDTGTLTHTASGGDYASVSNTLPVTVTDDAAAIVLSETDLTVTEGDAAGSSYTVRLATQPSDTVIVTISGHDGTDLTLDKTTLTFTVDNWDVAQTVTVEAGHDDDGSADTATPTHTASGGDYVNITKDLPVTITDDDCEDDVIWCATATFDAEVEWVARYNLHAGEVDRREFSYNGEDYLLWSIGMDQNGHNAGDDNKIVLPFGIPERTEFLIDFLNLNGTGHQEFEPPNDDWLDWTLHVSTVSDGETLTAALSFSEARKLGGAWWRWSGGDIDDLRRAWKPSQLYKLRLVEDPRSERTPQPLNTPLYLHVQGEEDGGRTQLYWLTPQTRYDLVPPVDNYKIQWKQSSGSWGTAADVSETTQGPSRQRPVSYRLDGLSPGVE